MSHSFFSNGGPTSDLQEDVKPKAKRIIMCAKHIFTVDGLHGMHIRSSLVEVSLIE